MATTINADRAAQRVFFLKEWTDAKRRFLNLWFNQESEFYSRICEFPVTRLLVLRVNLVSLCLIVGAVAIEQQPLFSTIAIACAGRLVYRLNKSEKEGGKK